MLLSILHETRYRYTPPVDVGRHLACLTPRSTLTQEVLDSQLLLEPIPEARHEQVDVFGNLRSFFSLYSRHQELHLSAKSVVRTRPAPQPLPEACASVPWEQVREYFRYRSGGGWDPAVEFCFASPHVAMHDEFAHFSQGIFTPGRPLLDAALALMARIHDELRYLSQSTDVHTPAHEALARRAGVCQDFAHIFLSCARQQGLAARYVSGYLLTAPPEGEPRLVGADASHAWVSVYIPRVVDGALAPGGIWFDLDPTNDRHGLASPGEDYVTLALGRDYADVSPVRGVIRGGAQHVLDVAVTVQALEETGQASARA